MEFVQITVEERPETGSRRMRVLRGRGLVPAVLYGQGKKTLSLTVAERELERFSRTGSRLVELRLKDQARLAIVREVQHDPVTDLVLHVDFVRVDRDKPIEASVPVAYKGRAKGATTGGIFQALVNDLRVRCRPTDLPRELAIDVTAMEVGHSLHAKDIAMPPGVVLVEDPESLIAHVVLPKIEVVATPVAEGAEAAPAEPELIRKSAAAPEEGEEAAAPAPAPKGKKA
jgi:large subunit ribosomal protein L25